METSLGERGIALWIITVELIIMKRRFFITNRLDDEWLRHAIFLLVHHLFNLRHLLLRCRRDK